MSTKQVNTRLQMREKIIQEDTKRLLKMFDEGWSFCVSARKVGMSYDYAMSLRRRDPQINEYITSKSNNKGKAFLHD
jgi:molybdenum-dependent DNA-binding transcriptional regulator ModE